MRSTTMPREFYIPKGSARVADKHSTGVVYVYASPDSAKTGRRFYAVAFHGKAARPDWHFSFRTEEQRANEIRKHFAAIASRERSVADRRASRTPYVHSLKVGDVLSYSWGYDQTNVQFYQVTARTPHTVTLREIGSAICDALGPMSETVRARRDAFLSDSRPFVKHVQPGDYVSMDHGCARACGETRKHYSSSYA